MIDSRMRILSIAVVATAMLIADSSKAEQFHSSTHGYEVEIPPGWVRIPQRFVEQLQDNLADSAKGAIYEAGFQPDTSTHWFEHPYVIIGVVPYSKLGIRGQLPERDIERFVESVTGLNPADAVKDEVSKLWNEFESGPPIIDKENHRFTWRISVDVDGVGHIRAVVVGFFGHEVLVQVMFYSGRSEWSQYEPVRQALFDSFRFEPDTDFQTGRSSFLLPIVGVGVVLAIAACFFVKRSRSG